MQHPHSTQHKTEKKKAKWAIDAYSMLPPFPNTKENTDRSRRGQKINNKTFVESKDKKRERKRGEQRDTENKTK